MFFEHKDKLNCRESQRLMALYVCNDPAITQEQRRDFERHILICPVCAAEYEKEKDLDSLLWKLPIITSTRQQADNSTSVEEGWERLKRSSPSLAKACRHNEANQKLKRFVWRVASLAAAACILIAVAIFALQNSDSGSLKPDVASDCGKLPAAYAEIVTTKGREPLALNQPITTKTQPCEILLGGMHRVVMNRNTEVAFGAMPVRTYKTNLNEHIVYNIQLTQGELYVEVVPGHPFTVKTANARLDITGTKFNVRTEKDRTDLTLLKGSVRFCSLNDDKYVHVLAGHKSSIQNTSSPSIPKQVDALAATTWARDFLMRDALTRLQTDLDKNDLESIRDGWMQTEPPDLDKIDYRQWQDKHRDWFKQQFPWIFKLQEFLEDQHKIKADYIDLLVTSGDIWQFNYPRPFGQPIPVFTTDSIEHIASHFKIERSELLKAVHYPSSYLPIARSPSTANTSNNAAPDGVYLAALKNWESDYTSAAKHPDSFPVDLLLFNFQATRYLANTHIAVYLWISMHPESTDILISHIKSTSFGEFIGDDALSSNESLKQYLHNRINAIFEVMQTTHEELLTPDSNNCQVHNNIVGNLN